MRKSIAILVSLFVISAGQVVCAGEPQTLTDKHFMSTIEERQKERAKIDAQIEKRIKAWEAKRQPRLSEFKKTLKDVGRFQAIKIRQDTVIILDTKEGHLWIWDEIISGYLSFTYAGQLCPGEYMGEKTIYPVKED
jgi:restriction endonuclease S subunit